jgi:hypothetical protein
MRVVSHDEQKVFHQQHANCTEPMSDRKHVTSLIDMVCGTNRRPWSATRQFLSIRRVSLEKSFRALSNRKALHVKSCKFAEKSVLN